MTLRFTPETLQAAYAFLAETPPFDKWNLPDAEEIKFKVARNPNMHGWHDHLGGKHTIAISRPCVGSTMNLIVTMAHEMVHVREWQLKVRGVHHGAAFKKLAHTVCKHHGFDHTMF